MSIPSPILAYGQNPKPGGITYVHQPDGSVDIYILPRPAWQLCVLAAIFVLPIALIATYGYLTGHVRTGGVAAPRWVVAFVLPAISLIGVGTILAVLILNFGRQSCYIHAGPDGLRVYYTELGDARQFEAPADQVLDVGFSRMNADGYKCRCLAFQLKGQKRTIGLLRRKKDILAIAAAVRRGLSGRS
ncbi:MAG: hypothetical protein ACM359_13345 [Bacillota bacterium]